jgi:hypothetical protein
MALKLTVAIRKTDPHPLKLKRCRPSSSIFEELDPYYELTSSNQPDAAKVPEENVKIEVLMI